MFWGGGRGIYVGCVWEDWEGINSIDQGWKGEGRCECACECQWEIGRQENGNEEGNAGAMSRSRKRGEGERRAAGGKICIEARMSGPSEASSCTAALVAVGADAGVVRAGTVESWFARMREIGR